ncbi:MAG: hypothetical protein KY476_17340, partial [Planctomycetes bacterium]|nr:hypothetical protein [Planctomycetota bacterium]
QRIQGDESDRALVLSAQRLALFASMGAPLLAGLAFLFVYNRAITGSGWTTPYQKYTDIYTPRHVYGFNNVIRGEQRLRPKVRGDYDRWAENLTPARAWRNVKLRLVASWRWTLGIVPLAMASVLFAAALPHIDRRWWLVPAGIVSLHAAHVPYWFSGIMHWHYVFETGPLWLLLFAGATRWLWCSWRAEGRPLMPVWWLAVALLPLLMAYLPTRSFEYAPPDPAAPAVSRVGREIDKLAFSRLKYAHFHREIARVIGEERGLVFIDAALGDAHVDYVVNDPALANRILYARLLPEEFTRPGALQGFRDRRAYWVVASPQLRSRIRHAAFPDYRLRLEDVLDPREPRHVELWTVEPAMSR